MAHFPKAQRFPPDKPSDIPGPGLYNPKLHDPTDDAWRKGALEIFKAPRSKDTDPGPDTFGLYNPDAVIDKPRTRSISTMATPSKHHNELLRLESKLFQYESKIESLVQSLQVSEQTVKETRRALQKSDEEHTTLQTELDKLRKQTVSVAGLTRKLADLQDEHEKSKARREAEITRLRSELRRLEDTSLAEKARLKTAASDTERASRTEFRTSLAQLYEHLGVYIPSLIHKHQLAERALRIERQLEAAIDVRVRKRLADRAAQVAELADIVVEQESREEELVEVIETLLDIEEQATAQAEDHCDLLESENERLRVEIKKQRDLDGLQWMVWQAGITEREKEADTVEQTLRNTQLELIEAQSNSAELRSNVSEIVEAYSTLSGICRSTKDELTKVREESATKDVAIGNLTKELDEANVDLMRSREDLNRSREDHSAQVEDWQAERADLQSRADEATQKATQETEARRKTCGELLVSRQAEAAVRGELAEFEQLQARLDEVEQEKARLMKLNDLLSRQSTLDAEETTKLAQLNAELISHQNPAQRLKVMDRIRREGKEERNNLAHLQNELWAARTEIDNLKTELSAYQAVPGPSKPSSKKLISGPKSPSQQLVGLSRVSRPALTQVTILGSRPRAAPDVSSLPLKFGRAGMKAKAKAPVVEPAELSSGAMKKQGRMTLEELR